VNASFEQVALLQAKPTRKLQLQQRCRAGLTASYEGTRTQSSEPSGASVTEQMFDRAARHASAAGPGMCDWHRLVALARGSNLLDVTAAIDPHTVMSAAGGAGGTTSYAALQGADAAWAKAKAQKVPRLPAEIEQCKLLSIHFV